MGITPVKASVSEEDRMSVHKNARLTPWGRERLARAVRSGQTPEAAARAAGVCPRTARKWVARFEAEGIAGLQDRSSRPHRLHRPTPMAVVERIEALRRQRFTGKRIAAELRVSPATVSRVLRRLGLNRIAALEPSVGSSSTSRSTMHAGSAPPRFWPTRKRRAPSPSSGPPSPTTSAWASPLRG